MDRPRGVSDADQCRAIVTTVVDPPVNHQWWAWDAAIDTDTCNKIVALGADQNWSAATIIDDEHGGVERAHDYRSTEVVWVREQWLYSLIWPYMEHANQRGGWRYDLRGCEPLQLAQYLPGGHYDIHADGNGSHYSVHNMPDDPILHGHTRKMTMTILLNDDFEGGEMEFVEYPNRAMPATVGSITMFPSFMPHQVKPVRAGTRYSLTAWFVGPPFK